jgi:cytochrome oxidase Cu insertion factor (SCO1/SenC/PrrC family)
MISQATGCSDECPLQMYNIASALEKVSTDVVEQIKVVFVTTDPTRDSAKVVRSWLDNFDQRFIGLTGSEAAIGAAVRAAAIFPVTKGISDQADYKVAHAACFRLLQRQPRPFDLSQRDDCGRLGSRSALPGQRGLVEPLNCLRRDRVRIGAPPSGVAAYPRRPDGRIRDTRCV